MKLEVIYVGDKFGLSHLSIKSLPRSVAMRAVFSLRVDKIGFLLGTWYYLEIDIGRTLDILVFERKP